MLNKSNSFAIIKALIVKNYFDGRLYDGMVVIDGRVAYVGDAATAKAIAMQHGVEVIDKGGKFVLPGFIDSHLHVESLGISIETADLSAAASIEELVEILRRKYLAEKPPILIGRGWDHERFVEKRMPTSRDLDRVTSDIPVVISRVCGHVVSVNTVALESLKEELRKFDESYVPRDEKGEPIGLLFEDAGYLAWNYASKFLDRKSVIMRAMERLASLGVTSVGWMSVNKAQIETVSEIARGGRLPIRLHLYVEPELLDAAGRYRELLNNNDFVKVAGVKLFADGSLGARTAYLSEDYADRGGWRGIPLLDEKKIIELTSTAVEKGLQPAVHAIGDEAIRTVLRAYKNIRSREIGARIEHVSLAYPDIIDELAKVGAIAVVQPRFVVSDWWAGDRLGERVRHLYPFRTMLKRGVKMALSTDSPVEPADPWLTVQAAELDREESLRREEALRLYTEGSASAIRRPDLGKLEPGFKADFIVVEFNPFAIPREKLSEARVLETYVDGKMVYSRGEQKVS